jgi:hypothetical protein
MKISMTEDQAQKVRQIIGNRNDPDLHTLDQRLAEGLAKREGNPQLTAEELGAVVALLEAAGDQIDRLDLANDMEISGVLMSALPKLKTMLARTQR